MRTFPMGYIRGSGSKSSKDKSFSSKGKIEKYNHDGTETIIVMGRPFRVLQKIGEGLNHAVSYKEHVRSKGSKDEARSYVFLVENTENLPEFPRHLALKRSFFNVDEVVVAHRELEILSRVRDKSIVRVYHSEVTRSDGKLGVSVAMEYCSNTLFRRLQQESRVTESEIVQVLIAITSAVGYLHTQQPPIAHRDICPDNILIHSASPGASAYRLCNFGSATTEAYECANREEILAAVEDIERYTTAAFRAPEMANPGGHKRIDERVDLWSIGVLLYYMMYLRLPFGETNMGLMGRLKLRFPPGTEMWYSGSLRVALEHLLEQDPEKRWDIFALTNFLRFNEDTSKHLGTFFFTATEWPDGWERQDVKVVNRPVPPKAPPLRVEGERHVSSAANDRNGDTHNTLAGHLQFVTRDQQEQQERQQQQQQQQQQQKQRSERRSSSAGMDELDAKALEVLGIDMDSTDPGMMAYREELIREQEEAWRVAKAASNAKNLKKAASATTRRDTSDDSATRKQQQQEQQEQGQKQKDAPVTEKKDDLFDVLFDSSPLAAPSSPLPLGAPHPPQFPTASPAQAYVLSPTQNVVSQLNSDSKNWQDSLFSSPPPPQQHRQNVMIDSGWGTGAPTMVPGGYDMGGMYATAQQQGLQQSMPPPWSAGPNLVPPRQQQQFNPQQTTADFTGGNFPPPQQQSVATTQSKTDKKKDPFEDLFT